MDFHFVSLYGNDKVQNGVTAGSLIENGLVVNSPLSLQATTTFQGEPTGIILYVISVEEVARRLTRQLAQGDQGGRVPTAEAVANAILYCSADRYATEASVRAFSEDVLSGELPRGYLGCKYYGYVQPPAIPDQFAIKQCQPA